MPNVNISILERRRANFLTSVRSMLLKALNPPGATPPHPTAVLAQTFQRYAATQQTAYESGVASSSASASSSVMERQVERAVSQVLGRSVGGAGSDGLGSALLDAFPVLPNGRVSSVPVRSVVSLNGTSSKNGAPASAISAGLLGQISAEQATLYRQATLIVPDARSVLAGIQPFSPLAETDVVESFRALVDSSFTTLLEEFGRIDEPRTALVKDYLDTLLGPDGTGRNTGHIVQFGDSAQLTGRNVFPATLADEAQVAGYNLLREYAVNLRTAWGSFVADRPLRSPNFSLRLARASLLLSVIAQGNTNLMSAMDSVGFSATERRSTASRFNKLQPGAITFTIPPSNPAFNAYVQSAVQLTDMTVNDLNDWIDRLASNEGPRLLAASGQYGLTFVTLQAEKLFEVIIAVLFALQGVGTGLNVAGQPVIVQVLNHERVGWALSDLVNQLDALAALAG